MRQALSFEHMLGPDGLVSDRRLVLDERGHIAAVGRAHGGPYDGVFALPGLPNAHSHCFQRALVGRGERSSGADTFWSWREAMYALANRITPHELRAVAAQAFRDMLCGGYTSVAEFHYLHHLPDGAPTAEMAQAVVQGAADAGIRLCLLPVLYVTGGFGPPGGEPPAGAAQRRFAHAGVDDFCRLLERLADAVSGIAPHSLRAVPPRLLAPLLEDARDLLGADCPVHIHVAEQPREVEQCQAAFGCGPVNLLADSVPLDARWSLVHATHATSDERRRMLDCDVNTVLCPLTEAYLADGVFPAAEYLRAGGRLAVGSDSNVRIDALEELRLLEYGQRLASGQRARLAGREGEGVGESLWQLACRTGAAALACPVGALAPGKPADLLVLDETSAVLRGVAPELVLDALVTGGSASSIRDVYVGGQQWVKDGKHVNDTAIARDFTGSMRALWSAS